MPYLAFFLREIVWLTPLDGCPLIEGGPAEWSSGLRRTLYKEKGAARRPRLDLRERQPLAAVRTKRLRPLCRLTVLRRTLCRDALRRTASRPRGDTARQRRSGGSLRGSLCLIPTLSSAKRYIP